jgi:hypothetical protein
MEEITANVNWLAVIVGAVLSFVLGWLWYSPKLFGTKWAETAAHRRAKSSAAPRSPLLRPLVGGPTAILVIGLPTVA